VTWQFSLLRGVYQRLECVRHAVLILVLQELLHDLRAFGGAHLVR
jgi:hypothetical protein